MIAIKKQITQDFSNISSGLNTAVPAIAVGQHQVTACMNAIIKEQGWKRSPGYLGLKSTPQFAAYLKGFHVYEQIAGTETVLSVSDGKLYSVNTSNGAITELYNLTGAGEALMANAYDKAFVCNGTKVVKVEGAVAYQVGITPPTGAIITTVIGGSLPDGVYNVYVSYARKVSGANVLYSVGQSLGDVTLGAGKNTLQVTIANSADAQVNNKIVWVREAGGSIWYFYHETGNNTITAFNISSSVNKNSSILYQVSASPNKVPGALQGIFFFDNRLFGFIDNVYYWSDKAEDQYKLEIWRASSFGSLPFNIISMFSIGSDLYFNTAGGIIRLQDGDVNSRYQIVDTRWHYRFPRTVDYWGGSVIGVTNNGVRTFDGSKFSTFDISKDIKPEIDRMYSGYSSNFPPCGKVVYRNTRSEYHLSFRDTSISSVCNNRHMILNLSSMSIYDENKYKVPWEEWEGGCSHIVALKDNTIYYGQSLVDGGQIFKENTLSNADRYIYNKSGTFITAVTPKKMNIQSRDYLANASAVVMWQVAQMMIRLSFTAKLQVKIRDRINSYTNRDVESYSDSLFDSAIFDQNTFSSENPVKKNITLKRQLFGTVSYWIFEQTADDENFDMVMLSLIGILKKTRFV